MRRFSPKAVFYPHRFVVGPRLVTGCNIHPRVFQAPGSSAIQSRKACSHSGALTPNVLNNFLFDIRELAGREAGVG